jgi:hypothetical protein
LGEVIEFASFAKKAVACGWACPGDEGEIKVEDHLVRLISRLMDDGNSLADIAGFLREQAQLLEQISERLAREAEDYRPGEPP